MATRKFIASTMELSDPTRTTTRETEKAALDASRSFADEVLLLAKKHCIDFHVILSQTSYKKGKKGRMDVVNLVSSESNLADVRDALIEAASSIPADMLHRVVKPTGEPDAP